MDFNFMMSSNRIACMITFAFFAWATDNAIAQSTCVAETVFSVNIQSKPTVDFNFQISNLSTSFSNVSNNSFSYSWNFGDPNSGISNTSSEANPIHVFTSPGNYTVTLIATNGCGSRSISKTVQASCPPLAVAAVANGATQICPGTSTLLTATSGFQGYQWLLNGNPLANSNTANITATMPGEYAVVVIDASGCTATSQGISIASLPLASPAFSSTINDLSAVFSNTSTNSTTYLWNFGDPNSGASNTSTETSPTHTFSAPGGYIVTLIATNNCGQQSITQNVQVACPALTVAAAANGATQICPGTSTLLTATSGFQGYQWLLNGNPLANSNTANLTANMPGEYTVIVNDASGCTAMSQGVSIASLPLASPSFSSTINDFSAAFSNTSTNSTTYLWNFGDPNSGASNTSTETSPTHVFSAPGTYLITLSATNTCGTQNTTQTVSIACPPLQVSVTPNSTLQFCEGGSVMLQATPPNLSAYQWYQNDMPIPSATNPTLAVTTTGQYKILVTDLLGCQYYSEVLGVAVYPLPLATIESTVGSAVCEGNSLVLTGSLGIGYQWVIPDGSTVSGENIAISTASISNNGTYQLTVTDGNGCTSTAVFDLFVNPLPLVTISGIAPDYKENEPPVPLIGTPAGGIFSGNGVAGGFFDPGAAGVGQHTLYYAFTDVNNCTNEDSLEVQVSPMVSTSNLEGVVSQMQVFPNPNHGDFRLEVVLSSNKTLKFSLMNTLGQTLAIRKESLPSGRSILHFDSHELNSGVYFITVTDSDKYACLKVIVTK
jgi:PKD repeat protein